MNPLSFLSSLDPQKWLTELIIVLALSLLVGFGGYELIVHIERIGYDRAKAEDTAQALKNAQVAMNQQAAMKKQYEDAQNEWKKREKSLLSDINASHRAVDSLRTQLTSANSDLSNSSQRSLANRVIALTDVFEQCTARYADLAEKADGHASDVQLIQGAWPK